MTISFLTGNGSSRLKDADWLPECFMLSQKDMPASVKPYQSRTTAHSKFTDTRLGGNWAINNPPAYTRFADPRVSGLNQDNQSGTAPGGMGMYYSEQLDDPSQIIHMCFGVPSFRGMLSFFSGMGNIEAGLLARTGRVPITFFVGKLVGVVIGLRLLPFILVGTVIKFLLGRTGSKYYNFRPTMHPYWNRVNFIANNFAVADGLVDRGYSIGAKQFEKLTGAQVAAGGEPIEPNEAAATADIVRLAHAACPEIFLEKGGIDVYRVASRVQSLADARRAVLEDIFQKAESGDLIKRVEDYTLNTKFKVNPENINDLADKIYNSEYGNSKMHDGTNTFDTEASAAAAAKNAVSGSAQTAGAAPAQMSSDGTVAPTETKPIAKEFETFDATVVGDPNDSSKQIVKPGWFARLFKSVGVFSKSGYNGGFRYVSFRVNSTGAISSSFSNSTRTPDIKSTINGFSSQAANMRFNFSQGVTGIPGLDHVVEGIKNAALGLVSGIDLMGLVSLAGSSFIDIPDHWEDSTATFPSESYTINLRTPYGNALSRFMNLYVPLSMLLAGALPISTGRQSYTSPFICQLYSEGRCSIKLGMIDSLSVTHGVGNLGFNKFNKPLGMDISFTVKDLNRTMHAPIDTGGSILNPLNVMSAFDDDNAFNDYINVLSAVSMADQTIPTRRLSMKLRVKMMQWDSFWTVGNMTAGVFESSPGRFLQGLGTMGGAVFGGGVAPQFNRALGN